jgi:hypothetical protein
MSYKKIKKGHRRRNVTMASTRSSSNTGCAPTPFFLSALELSAQRLILDQKSTFLSYDYSTFGLYPLLGVMKFCQTAVLSSIYCRKNATKYHKILLAVVGM